LVLSLCAIAADRALAAVPEFVGVLALAVEDDVAQKVGLSEQQVARLTEFIDRREAEAISLAQEAKSLPDAERDARLAAFRESSEKDGLKLLSDEQVERLRAIERERADGPPVDEPAEPAEPGEGTDPPAEPGEGTDPPAEPSEEPVAGLPNEGRPPEPADADDEQYAPRRVVVIEPPARPANGKLRFSFRYQPWKDVLDWFAEQADLSLAIDAPPPGTFNYTDTREYTPAEAIDLLNSVLLTKGYTLVRRNRMLMLINLEDGIPPNLVDQVPMDELDQRGAYELVSTLFTVSQMTPEEAETEINKLLGPQGSVVVMPKAGMIQVTETAGRLRTIRKVIQAVEDPDGTLSSSLRQFELLHATAEDVLPVLRGLLNLPDDSNAAADGSIRIAVDPTGTKLLVTGKEQRVNQLSDIIKAVDVPGLGGGTDVGPIETPQLEVYTVTAADPDSALQVLQTLLAGEPDVRLTTDPKTGNLVALARPSQHATIRATLDQMQRDARQIDVIRLMTVDPQLAVLAINKLFGGGGETPSRTAPQVDADPLSRTLLVRASEAQIAQIRELLVKMGETEGGEAAVASRGNVRMLPVEGRAARSTLEQIQELWPTMRANKIRVVAPSSVIPTFRPSRPADEQERPLEPLLPLLDGIPPAKEPAARGDDAGKSTAQGRRMQFHLVGQPLPAGPSDTAKPAAGKSGEGGEGGEPADIIVAPGPGGTMIASDDLEALDEFESLFTMLANRSTSGREKAVFYLKYAKATTVADTLTSIFGGGAAADGGGGGGGLLGDIAGAALGGMGGGLFGDLLGGGGGVSTAGAIEIVPDARLNLLVVQAKPVDLDLVEQLLIILDQETSPEEVQVVSRPKLIPVFNTSAAEVAGVVRQVYQDRMIGSGSSQQRQPSPEEFMQALRGGRGRGRGGSSGSDESEVQKLSIGIDERSNSLIVAAPEPLFSEVEALVHKLDVAITTSTETTRVVTLKRTNPEAMRKALASVLGDSVTTGTTNAGTSAPAGATAGSNSNAGDAARQADDMRRRMEFIQRIRQMQEQGGGGDRGRGGGGGPPSGGGDRGRDRGRGR
jgi:type II secretory pathway component GspD/PulD (secretin)